MTIARQNLDQFSSILSVLLAILGNSYENCENKT